MCPTLRHLKQWFKALNLWIIEWKSILVGLALFTPFGASMTREFKSFASSPLNVELEVAGRVELWCEDFTTYAYDGFLGSFDIKWGLPEVEEIKWLEGEGNPNRYSRNIWSSKELAVSLGWLRETWSKEDTMNEGWSKEQKKVGLEEEEFTICV